MIWLRARACASLLRSCQPEEKSIFFEVCNKIEMPHGLGDVVAVGAGIRCKRYPESSHQVDHEKDHGDQDPETGKHLGSKG